MRINKKDLIFELFMGGLVLFVGLYFLASCVPEVHMSAYGPKRMTLAEAARITSDERQFVVIEDGMWDCASISYSYSNSRRPYPKTHIFLTDNGNPKHIVLRVTMEGRMQCADFESVKLVGYLERMHDSVKQELIREGRLVAYPEATEFLQFRDDYYSLGKSLCGAGLGVFIAIIGLCTLIESPRLAKRYSWASKRKPDKKSIPNTKQKKKRKHSRSDPGDEANPFHDSPPDDLG